MPDSDAAEPTRLERGNYIADVLHHTSVESFWYYIIQRRGSREVIDLVKCDSYEQAIAASQQVLEKLNVAAARNP